MPTAGRNDPCPCGSGKRYKRCCLDKDQAAALAPLLARRAEQEAAVWAPVRSCLSSAGLKLLMG